MKKLMALVLLTGLVSLPLSAQRRGRGGGPSGPPATAGRSSEHSNAPAGTPAWSGERDFGSQRAAESGKGKKKGLNKNQGQGEEHRKAPEDRPGKSRG